MQETPIKNKKNKSNIQKNNQLCTTFFFSSSSPPLSRLFCAVRADLPHLQEYNKTENLKGLMFKNAIICTTLLNATYRNVKISI